MKKLSVFHLFGTMLFAVGGAQASTQETIRYIHTDALGSVVAVTDTNGHVIERREYEPYGAQLVPQVQDGPGYTGHVQDAETGLVYMQQRYYDPLGRFLSVDPITAAGGREIRHFNRYSYANNSPYGFVDPDGERGILREAQRHSEVASLAPINPYTGSVLPTAIGVVTSGYGKRVHPVTGQTKLHNGTDFRAPKGAEILSTQSGQVKSITSGGSGGSQVMVQNNDGSLSGYAHTAPAEGISSGADVQAGSVIGISDGSGRATGPHLHYTYRPGTQADPATTRTPPVDPIKTQLKEREIKRK